MNLSPCQGGVAETPSAQDDREDPPTSFVAQELSKALCWVAERPTPNQSLVGSQQNNSTLKVPEISAPLVLRRQTTFDVEYSRRIQPMLVNKNESTRIIYLKAFR